MEDPTPYRVTLPKMELISSTRKQVMMHRDGITTYEEWHDFAYEGGTSIHLANGEFVEAELNMSNPYTRADWRRLAAIDAEITRLEAAAYPEGLKI